MAFSDDQCYLFSCFKIYVPEFNVPPIVNK